MKLNDILNVEGIVIRKIPMESVSIYNYESRKELLSRPNVVKFYSEVFKRDMIKETKFNSMGGKYLITKCNDQSSMVRFDKKTCGIGDTIEDAYNDFLKKN